MKSFVLIFGCSLIASLSLSAQPGSKDHPITRESFFLRVQVDKNGGYQALSFVAPQASATRAKIISPGELSELELAPGTVLEGEFIFGLFSGPSGTGKTIHYQGQGTGTLILDEDSRRLSGKKAPLKNIKIRLRKGR